MYTTDRETLTSLEAVNNMYIPPVGTEYHCIPECFKGYKHYWQSEEPGVPIRCSHCKTPYHHVFPKKVTKEMVIENLCDYCLKAWNLLKPTQVISKQEIVELNKPEQVEMWNKAYPKDAITAKDLKHLQKTS